MPRNFYSHYEEQHGGEPLDYRWRMNQARNRPMGGYAPTQQGYENQGYESTMPPPNFNPGMYPGMYQAPAPMQGGYEVMGPNGQWQNMGGGFDQEFQQQPPMGYYDGQEGGNGQYLPDIPEPMPAPSIPAPSLPDTTQKPKQLKQYVNMDFNRDPSQVARDLLKAPSKAEGTNQFTIDTATGTNNKQQGYNPEIDSFISSMSKAPIPDLNSKKEQPTFDFTKNFKPPETPKLDMNLNTNNFKPFGKLPKDKGYDYFD